MLLGVTSGICQARCVGMITDRHNVVEMSSLEFGHVLRARDIDSHLSHHLHSSWSTVTLPPQDHFETFYIDVNSL